MSRDGRCRHPDCAYRNHSNPIQQGRCNYMAITGRSRIKGLPPELQKPCNCPYYETDGSRKQRPQAELPPTPDVWKLALMLYETGATDREIAEELGINKKTWMCRRWKVYKLPANPDRRGSAPRFDWAMAERLYKEGLSDVQIARRLGCSTASVWHWRWNHEMFPNGKRGPKTS